jgi:hypothetical protein
LGVGSCQDREKQNGLAQTDAAWSNVVSCLIWQTGCEFESDTDWRREVSVPSKIRIRMGRTEVEYEGSEEFIRSELPDLLAVISEIIHRGRHAEPEEEEQTQVGEERRTTNPGTTASIAAKLKCNSAPDLALAAGARLVFGLKQEAFSRQVLLQEMQSARSYYKQTMSGNLSKTLEGLVKTGKLNEVSTDTYSLAQAERSRIEAILANG